METNRRKFFRNVTLRATSTKEKKKRPSVRKNNDNFDAYTTPNSSNIQHNAVRRLDFAETIKARKSSKLKKELVERRAISRSPIEKSTPESGVVHVNQHRQTAQNNTSPVVVSQPLSEKYQLEIVADFKCKEPVDSTPDDFQVSFLNNKKTTTNKRKLDKTDSHEDHPSLPKVCRPITRSLTKQSPKRERPVTRSLTKKRTAITFYSPIRKEEGEVVSNANIIVKPHEKKTENNQAGVIFHNLEDSNSFWLTKSSFKTPLKTVPHASVKTPEIKPENKQLVEVMIHRVEDSATSSLTEDFKKIPSKAFLDANVDLDRIDVLNDIEFTDENIEKAISRMDLEESEGEVIEYFSEASLGNEEDDVEAMTNLAKNTVPEKELITLSDLNVFPLDPLGTRLTNTTEDYLDKMGTNTYDISFQKPAQNAMEIYETAINPSTSNYMIPPGLNAAPVFPELINSFDHLSDEDAGSFTALEVATQQNSDKNKVKESITTNHCQPMEEQIVDYNGSAMQQVENEDLKYVAPLRHWDANDYKNLFPQTTNPAPFESTEYVINQNKRLHPHPTHSYIPSKIPKKKDFFNNQLQTGKENRIPPNKKITVMNDIIIKHAKNQKDDTFSYEIQEHGAVSTEFDYIEENHDTEKEEDPDKNKTNTKEEKRLQRKTEMKKYIDFLSDDEDFVWSSSSWDEFGSGSDTDTSDPERRAKTKTLKKKKKKVKKLAENTGTEGDEVLDMRIKKKKLNKVKEAQKQRNRGEEYTTKKGRVVPGKNVKSNPCQPGICSNGCYEIKEEKRLRIFNHYWNLSAQRKKDWIVGNTLRTQVGRRRTKSNISRRQFTYKYFINEGEGKRQVCQSFLLKTLNVGQKYVHRTLENAQLGSSKDDLRGMHKPPNKTPLVLTDEVRHYIKNLPAVPSHYCRKKTTRVYLPQDFKNLSNLYRVYKETQCASNKPFVGEKVFRSIFGEFNIGFHVPRKDKCGTCLKHEAKKLSEEDYASHLKDKEDTLERFKKHQNMHLKDDTVLCTSFDLQKVLNTPHSTSLLLYYYRKVSVFNLTFYESGTRDGFCYTWSEVEGKRGANEMCSILQKYVEMVDERGTVKHLLLYSDCCPGQNRNRFILACLHKCLQQCENITNIQMNYLLTGHTYMPVDSMHSVIEKSVRNSSVWSPSQWPAVFSLARKVPKPYTVTALTHKDFMAWDVGVAKYFKNLAGKISKIRIATLKKSQPDKIFVKFSMDKDAATEEITVLKKKKETELKKSYKSRLQVSTAKYQDILTMLSSSIIPEMYHSEYNRFKPSETVQDVLEDTDVEDIIEIEDQ